MNLRQILSYSYLGQQRFKLAFCSKVTTVLMKFRLFLVNATIGKDAIFFGKTYLQVHPSGIFTCGENAVFRSSELSNSIGLKQRCFLSVGRNARLTIGDKCGFSGSVINAMLSIQIGSRVMLGANVTIADSDRHPINAKERVAGDGGICKPVVIGDDVWVGMNTVILKGSIIGNNVVIGANSLVSGQIPPNCIAVGNPVKVIKMLEPLND